MLRMLNATHAYCNAVRLNDGSWAGRNGSVDGWAPSTVSREIRRNGGWRAYRASEADASAWQCAKRPKRCKLAQNRALARLVAEKLRLQWSPYQVAGWLKRRYPQDETRQVSHE